MNKLPQVWIRNKVYDLLFILSPPFLCIAAIYIFPGAFENNDDNPEWVWFALVLCIDVGHVYSTIYRTYLDKERFINNNWLLYLSPIFLYTIGVILHSINPLLFWRVLTYFAVFHFIRQQYGFLRIYTKNETNQFSKKLDAIIIYAATLFPIFIWHLDGKQDFNWFVENDFIYINQTFLIPYIKYTYATLIVFYYIIEIKNTIIKREIQLQKNLIIIGSILSWYMGIVYFKGDLTFTFLNVICHGIPYYALVWAFCNKSKLKDENIQKWHFSKIFSPKYILVFIGFIILLAYIEESLWDGFIWKEHPKLFPSSQWFPDMTNNQMVLSLLIPLLSLPQILHYFIDGFIWKVNRDKTGWIEAMFK